MNEFQDKQGDLLDTTDWLEAVGVFRGWKNTLFVIVILCLLGLQLLFWAANLGLVDVEAAKPVSAEALPASETTEPNTAIPSAGGVDANKIAEAAKAVTADANLGRADTPLARAAEPMPIKTAPAFRTKFKHAAWFVRALIRFLDFVLMPAAILYCLTLLFCLKISLLGRLGGINHISRAFFLSLLFVVLLLPWQRFFGSAMKGAIYLPDELAKWLYHYKGPTSGIFAALLYYLRFTGYWLLVVLVVVFSQIRSARWAKATLRRLEVI